MVSHLRWKVVVLSILRLHAGQLPLQVLRFLPPEMEGDSAQLVPFVDAAAGFSGLLKRYILPI